MEKFSIHWWIKLVALSIMIPAIWMMYYVWQKWPGVAIIPSFIIGGAILITILPFVSGATINDSILRYGGFVKKTINLKNVDHMEEERHTNFNLHHGQYSGISLRFYMKNNKQYLIKNARGFGYPEFYDKIEAVSGKKIKEFQFGKISRHDMNRIKDFVYK